MHTLADPLRYAGRNYAERPATICGDVRRNYRELTARCRRLGGALHGLGLRSAIVSLFSPPIHINISRPI